ncbi:MAG: hypothetical protein K2K21_06550 [Lachnospiraceae bacterium]|nr:hypothetical protein [Lachnospiraceae bacterium]
METEKEYDDDKNYTLRSRIIVFEREMEHLKNLMYGRCVTVWNYMTDSQGKYSEERTIGLIEQIINEIRYRRMHIWDFDKHADKLTFYKNILYCVLRAYTSNYTECSGGNRFGYGKPEEILFFDILSAFEDSTGELLDGNVVFLMETLYEIFTGRSICLDVLNAEREKMEQTEKYTAETEDMYTGKPMEEALAEELGYNIEEIREEEQSFIEEEENLAQAEREKVCKQFADKEHFCHSLDEVYCYLKETPISYNQVRLEIKALVDGFLSDIGLSVFQDEDAYVEAMVQLKKTIRTAQKYTEDGK